MKRRYTLAAAVLVSTLLAAPASARAQSTAQQIADAVLPLPENLKAGATVVTHDPDTGERIVLRQGSNQVECNPPDMDAMQTACYGKSMAPLMDRVAKLTAEGNEDPFGAALADETLPEIPYGTMTYNLRHDDRRIKLLWAMFVPGATSESIGVSTITERNDGLKGTGRPWLMAAGTPMAHIMIPINGTPLSSGQ